MEVDSAGGYKIYDKTNKLLRESAPNSVGQSEHVANFCNAIRQDNWQLLNAEIAQGHRSTLLCHLGNIAHRVGRSLACDSANGHIQNDDQAIQGQERFERHSSHLPKGLRDRKANLKLLQFDCT